MDLSQLETPADWIRFWEGIQQAQEAEGPLGGPDNGTPYDDEADSDAYDG